VQIDEEGYDEYARPKRQEQHRDEGATPVACRCRIDELLSEECDCRMSEAENNIGSELSGRVERGRPKPEH
jgi:hypothetical protein